MRNTRRVYFSTETLQTKTGITLDETKMTPDWRNTDSKNVHLFEIGKNGFVNGEDVEINISEDKKTAQFSADFSSSEMTIIINDEDDDTAPEQNSSSETVNGPWTYAAIVAQEQGSTYIVPAVQHPDKETLIDPAADFLIGYSRISYPKQVSYDDDPVDLYFDRPVALGRINVVNFTEEGEKVKNIVIKAEGLSGSTTYEKVNFEAAAVEFVPSEVESLTLDYGDGVGIEDKSFVSYFVVLPGAKQVSEIIVSTDKWIYTKTIDNELEFSKDSFKNLKLDLEGVNKVPVEPEDIKWYKASVLEDGIDYIIVSDGYALKNSGSESVVSAQKVEIVDNTIISPAQTEGIIWRAANVPDSSPDNHGFVLADYGTHTLSNGSENLWRHSDNGTFTLESNSGGITKYMIWSYDGEYLTNHSIYVSGSSSSASHSDYYAYYKDGWKISTTKTAATLYTSRAPQEISFTPEAKAEFDLATDEWIVAIPTLSGAQTSVTYALSEDSNPAVATVDKDGTVYPISRGTVTIVATAAGNAQYQAASTSYTLNVVDSNFKPKIYRKVTSAADLEVGTQYILVYESDSKVFKPIYVSGSNAYYTAEAANALDVVISNGTITSADLETSEMTLESGYHFYVVSDEKYLYPTNSSYNSSCIAAENTKSDTHTFSISISSSGVATISRTSNNSTYRLCYSDYFRGSSSVSANVSLYKLDDGREAQVLSFSPETATYDLYTPSAFVKPTLSTAYGTVTYSSSDDTIAEVDNSGNIIGKKKGTVTITATAEGNTQYKPGTASYILTVENSDPSAPSDPVYKKVITTTDLVAGAKYLIVNSDATKVFKPFLNGDNFDKTRANAIADGFTVEGNTIVSSELEACQVIINTLSSGYSIYVPATETYWYLTSNNMGSETSAGSSHYSSITVDNGAVTIKRGSSNYYMRYSTNSGYFYENSNSSTVALYRLEDGSTPGGGDDPTPGGGD